MTTFTQLAAKVTVDTSDLPTQLAATQEALTQGVGAAAQQAQLRLDTLSDRIGFQKRQLTDLAAELAVTRSSFGDESAEVSRLQLTFDRLSASIGANERQLAISQQRIRENGESASLADRYFQQFGSSAAQSVLSIVGPAAAASAAMGGLVAVGKSFVDAFNFKVQLDTNTEAVKSQISAFANANDIYNEAIAFGEKYKITQSETLNILQSGTDILRNSTSSVNQLEEALIRLQSKAPEKPISEAARALRELSSGDVTTIRELFNLSANDANRLKNEIAAGADPVQVLTKYLNDAKIGMEALELRTKGAQGALNDYATAVEKLKIAQGEFAKGPGANFLSFLTVGIQDATHVLSDGEGITGVFQNLYALMQANTVASAAFNAALLRTGDVEKSIAIAAAVRGQVYRDAVVATIEGTNANEGHRRSLEGGARALSDYVDISKLTTDQLKALREKFETTGEKASEAYAKINDARTKYLADSQSAQADHENRLDQIETESGERQKAIVDDTLKRIGEIQQQQHQRNLDLTEQAGRQLYRLEQNNGRELQRLKEDQDAEAAQRLSDYLQRIADTRAESAKKIADFQKEIGQKQIADTQEIEQQIIDARQRAADTLTNQIAANAERENELRETAQERQAEQAEAYQQRLLDLQQSYADRRTDQAEDRAQDLADRAEDRQRDAEDRARDHAEKIAELQRKAAEEQATGVTIGLDGARSKTALPGSGNDIQSQIEAEERRYAEQERKAQEAETRQQERDRRQQERADKNAERAYQRQIEAAEKQRQQQEIADAAQLAKQEAALARQQEAQEKAYQRQLELADRQAEKQREALGRQLAEQVAKLQQAIQDEQQAQSDREIKLKGSYDQQEAETAARQNRAAARRKEDYDLQVGDLKNNLAEQIRLNDEAARQQIEKQKIARDEQLQAERLSLRKKIEDEKAHYAEQEAERTKQYLAQKQKLEEALGDQLKAYAQAQVNLGLITKTEGERRIALAEALFQREARAARNAFNEAFGADFGTPFDTEGSRRNQNFLSDRSSAGPAGVAIGSIPITVNSQSSDPVRVAEEVRRIFVQGISANGGNVAAFFGGT